MEVFNVEHINTLYLEPTPSPRPTPPPPPPSPPRRRGRPSLNNVGPMDIETRRLRNTISAKKCRLIKNEKMAFIMKELENEKKKNKQLEKKINTLERQLYFQKKLRKNKF